LKIFPSGGMPTNPNDPTYFLQYIYKMILPVITITVGSLASIIRYVRGAMLEVLSKDYIKTARAKGLSEKTVIYYHAFRNALIPVVTILSMSIVGVFAGSAITETIFVWDGIGRVLVNSLTQHDFSVVLALDVFYAILTLISNVVMDVSYSIVDPRVRLG
jgi:peptide/nickel transport system permease protein